MKICKYEGCGKNVLAKQMCSKHYRANRRKVTTDCSVSYIPIKGVSCTECGGPVQAKNLCAKHYIAARRAANPEKAKEYQRKQYEVAVARRRELIERGLLIVRSRPGRPLGSTKPVEAKEEKPKPAPKPKVKREPFEGELWDFIKQQMDLK